MACPFPGMDPWLERPSVWPSVHHWLITYSHDALRRQLGDRYLVDVGERVYVEAPEPRNLYPDVYVFESREPGHGSAIAAAVVDEPLVLVLPDAVEMREVYLEIREATSNQRVVAVIEVLSPTNKRPGSGRDLYVQKQTEVLASTAHLVEIDLLRAGAPTVALPAAQIAPSAYRVVTSPATSRCRREVYRFGLKQRLPRVAVPLLEGDPAVALDIPAIFAQAYENGAYARRIDYSKPPDPPLAAEDEAWARDQVAKARAGA